MNNEARAYAEMLERCGYLPTLRRLARQPCCPFFWYDDSRPAEPAILHSGTAVCIQGGSDFFALTADHVLGKYLQQKADIANIRCQFGGMTFEPAAHVLKRFESDDIAAIRLPSVMLAPFGVEVHHATEPAPLAEGEWVIFGGYPGNRRYEGVRRTRHDFVSFITRVRQCSEAHSAYQLDLAESHWPQGERLGPGVDLGGLSGGPVFRVRETPIVLLELVGIVTESHKSLDLVRANNVPQAFWSREGW